MEKVRVQVHAVRNEHIRRLKGTVPEQYVQAGLLETELKERQIGHSIAHSKWRI